MTVFTRQRRHHVSRVSLGVAQPTSLPGCLMVHCALTHASSVVVTPLASATRPRLTAHSANTIAAVARNVRARSAHAAATQLKLGHVRKQHADTDVQPLRVHHRAAADNVTSLTSHTSKALGVLVTAAALAM